MSIDQLLEAIRAGGDEAHEAALTLGLLLEHGGRREDDDRTIQTLIGEEWVNVRLTGPERRSTVRHRLDDLTKADEPHPMAIWALTKRGSKRILSVLIELLERTLDDPAKEHVAYQALVGITLFFTQQSLAALRQAAQRGHG